MRTRRFVPWMAACAALIAVGSASPAHARLCWLRLLVPAASADEVMKFEPVSPESAQAMERRHVHVGPATSAESEHPDVPEPPDTPDAPVAPEVSRGGDVVRIGSDIHIERGQVVEGDVFTLRGDITIDGHVKGNVATTGGDVHLGPTAKVDGDVMCIGGELTEDPGATVLGQRVTALRGGSLRERIKNRIHQRIEENIGGRTHDRGGALGFSLSWLLFSMLIAWLLTKIAPVRTMVALDSLRERPGSSFGVGLLMVLLLGPSVVALALAMAILCITIIGIPLALLLVPTYVAVLTILIMWGFVLGATNVGQQLTGRWPSLMSGPASLRRHAVLGALAVTGMLFASAILRFLPFFGWVSTLLWVLGWVSFGFITTTGAGALLRSKFGLGPEGRWWPPFAPGTAPVTPAGGPPPVAPPPPPPPPAPPAVTDPLAGNPPATS